MGDKVDWNKYENKSAGEVGAREVGRNKLCSIYEVSYWSRSTLSFAFEANVRDALGIVRSG